MQLTWTSVHQLCSQSHSTYLWWEAGRNSLLFFILIFLLYFYSILKHTITYNRTWGLGQVAYIHTDGHCNVTDISIHSYFYFWLYIGVFCVVFFKIKLKIKSKFPRNKQQTKFTSLLQLNETLQNWSVQAEVCGEGFSGPDVVDVPAGTKQIYPLTVLPTSQCIATVTLS